MLPAAGTCMSFVVDAGIFRSGFDDRSPSAGSRRTEDDAVDIEDPVISPIAKATWRAPGNRLVSNGRSRKGPHPVLDLPERSTLSNLRAAVSEPHRRGDEGHRRHRPKQPLHKSYFWRDGQSWEDLWDLDGAIANEFRCRTLEDRAARRPMVQ